MFHRQSVCGLILGLTLVLLAGVFRPGEGVAPAQSNLETNDTQTNSLAESTSPATPDHLPRDLSEDKSAPGTSTSRSGGEAPGTLP